MTPPLPSFLQLDAINLDMLSVYAYNPDVPARILPTHSASRDDPAINNLANADAYCPLHLAGVDDHDSLLAEDPTQRLSDADRRDAAATAINHAAAAQGVGGMETRSQARMKQRLMKAHDGLEAHARNLAQAERAEALTAAVAAQRAAQVAPAQHAQQEHAAEHVAGQLDGLLPAQPALPNQVQALAPDATPPRRMTLAGSASNGAGRGQLIDGEVTPPAVAYPRQPTSSNTKKRGHANGSGGGGNNSTRCPPTRPANPVEVTPETLKEVRKLVDGVDIAEHKLGPKYANTRPCNCKPCQKDGKAITRHGRCVVFRHFWVCLSKDGTLDPANCGYWEASTNRQGQSAGPAPLGEAKSKVEVWSHPMVPTGEKRQFYKGNVAELYQRVFGPAGLNSDVGDMQDVLEGHPDPLKFLMEQGAKEGYPHNLYVHTCADPESDGNTVLLLAPQAVEKVDLFAAEFPGFSSRHNDIDTFLGNRQRVSGCVRALWHIYQLACWEFLLTQYLFFCVPCRGQTSAARLWGRLGFDESDVEGVNGSIYYQDPRNKTRGEKSAVRKWLIEHAGMRRSQVHGIHDLDELNARRETVAAQLSAGTYILPAAAAGPEEDEDPMEDSSDEEAPATAFAAAGPSTGPSHTAKKVRKLDAFRG